LAALSRPGRSNRPAINDLHPESYEATARNPDAHFSVLIAPDYAKLIYTKRSSPGGDFYLPFRYCCSRP